MGTPQAKVIFDSPVKVMRGKHAQGCNLSYRETYGSQHTYVLQNPYQGPASEAQTSMRQIMGAATQYAAIILRDPAVLAEWKTRCKGTHYRRVDRFCVAECYKTFKSDPEQLQVALQVIEQDKQHRLAEQTAINKAKAKAQQQSEEPQDPLSPAFLLRQTEIMAAQIADLQAKLKAQTKS